MFTLRRWSALAAEPGDVEYLDVEDLVALAALLLGEPPPIRDLGLLGSAAARPAASAFGEDAYPDIWLKAAALLQCVLKNHPLVDGNKRLGWLSTAVFLDLNGVDASRASNDDVYDFVMSVPASQLSVEEIAEGLRRIVGKP
ncbi:MAG TPA: type II toxin-antitoxin system death-on-curing family toxin [Acidimicrobiales bacterium]|nr:type II toxin-antitoxin system death-on-curing family toxin [Acidimicrobiales bacterium]